MRRLPLFYVAALALALACAGGILRAGRDLAPGLPRGLREAAPATPAPPARPGRPFALLLAQILVVSLAARAAAAVSRGLGQPAVIGEIAAGLALGPSLLGALLPGAHAALFPPESLETLHLISQVGILVFMFLVGLELDPSVVRERASTAVVVSHVSILLPYLLGMALALRLYGRFAPADVPFSAFALFLGIAMSITAFPVLARILDERGLSGTPLGSAALTCAAVDDATAWSLLAVVLAVAGAGSALGALRTLALALGFVACMLGGVRPWLAAGRRGPESAAQLFLYLSLAFASALATELMGIHALFGAFLAGVCVPRLPALRGALRERLEGFSGQLLVPLFFAFTGLRTRLDVLGEPGSIAVLGLILAAAMAGKFGGSAAAARLTGMDWRDSLSLGALMNTRGLMELVVLNVGYDLGILSPGLFALLVVMALLTTLMTGPALALIDRFARRLDSGSALAVGRSALTPEP